MVDYIEVFFSAAWFLVWKSTTESKEAESSELKNRRTKNIWKPEKKESGEKFDSVFDIFIDTQKTKQTTEKSYFVYDPIYFGSLIFGFFLLACDFVRLNFHLERHRRHKHKINRTEQCVLRYRRRNGHKKNRYIPPYHQLIAHTVLSVCVCVWIVWYETLSRIYSMISCVWVLSAFWESSLQFILSGEFDTSLRSTVDSNPPEANGTMK